MSRTLCGGGVLVMRVVAGGQCTSRLCLPSLLPPLPPSSHSPSHQYTHLASPRSCSHRPVWPSFPFLPQSLSTPPFPATFFPSARLGTSTVTLKTRPVMDGGVSPKDKPKERDSPLITLIDTQDKVSKMSLDQAERLARRRDLKLVRVADPSMRKGGQEVYRLLTGKQYFEEQVKEKRSDKKPLAGNKDEKTLGIGGNITQHDLAFKLQNVFKWLSKGHQIRVSIISKKATKENMENIFAIIEKEVKEVKGRILQRHEKMGDIRFYIAPPKVKKEQEDTTNKETAEEDSHAQSDEPSSDQGK